MNNKQKIILLIIPLLFLISLISVNASVYDENTFISGASSVYGVYKITNSTGSYLYMLNSAIGNPTGKNNYKVYHISNASYLGLSPTFGTTSATGIYYYGGKYYDFDNTGVPAHKLRVGYSNGTTELLSPSFTGNTGINFMINDKVYWISTETAYIENLYVYQINNNSSLTLLFSDTSHNFFNNLGINNYSNGLYNANQFVFSGLDYDNNRVIITNLVNNKSYALEEDFYITNSYTDVTNLYNISKTILQIGLQFQKMFPYFIINNNIVYGQYNASVVLSYGFVDEYGDLTCTNDGEVCGDAHAMCFPNNELFPGINESNYICNNVSVNGDQSNYAFYCNSDFIFCAGGCESLTRVNAFGIPYGSAICYNESGEGCINDPGCNVEGMTYSDTYGSYRTCGFYDTDICLDWGFSIPCNFSQISIDGICEELNTSGTTYYGLRNFIVNPQLENLISYSNTAIPPYVNIETNQAGYYEGFTYTSGVAATHFNINLNCDYTEQQIYNDITASYINTSLTKTFSGYTNGITTIKFNLAENQSIKIEGKDAGDNTIFEYNITENTTHGVCIYSNNTMLGCRTLFPSDYRELELSIQTIKPWTQYYSSAKLQFNLNNPAMYIGDGNHIYTGFLTPITTITTSLTKIVMTSLDANYISLNVKNGEQLETPMKDTTNGIWTQDDGTVFYENKCYYSTSECSLTRHYYLDDLGEGLWNYKDYKVCVTFNSSSPGTQPGDDNDTGGVTLTQDTKLLLAILLPLALIFFFMYMGYKTGNSTAFKGLTFVGVFFGIGLLIYFALHKWIDAWIIILMMIIAGFAVVMFMKNVLLNSGGGE